MSLLNVVGNNCDTLQQIALLAWLQKGDDAKYFLEAVTAYRVAKNLFTSLTGRDKVEAYRTEAILAIAKYVQDHPRAEPQEIQIEVNKQVEIFKQKIKT